MDIYESDMKAAGKCTRIISGNMDMADTYINYFLLRLLEESNDMGSYEIKDENRAVLEEGCGKISYYISYYYIYKDLSASPYNLKATVSGIKDFYQCMQEHGIVSKESFDLLCFIIESDLGMWLEECNQMST